MRIPDASLGLLPRRIVQTALLLCLGCCVARGERVAMAEGEAAGPSATEVRQALSVFAKASKSKDPSERATAVRTLGAMRHAKVALRLLKFAKREAHGLVLAATYEALGTQVPSKKILAALVKRLEAELEAEAERIKRGRTNFRIDPRTGDPDTGSAEGLAALAATEQRAVMMLALLKALDAIRWTPGDEPPDLTPFLQDPSDDLAVAVLERLGTWKAWYALPQLHFLHRMYPVAQLWETGAVEQAGGTDATAKAAWMMLFGHPDKQRSRPKVHAALIAALKAITGKDFDSPEALGTYLERKDVKARIAGKRPQR